MERIAEGREAEIFAWEPGTVLKLYRTGANGERARREAEATAAVAGAGGPAPRPRGLVSVEGRAGLLMERIEGVDLVGAMLRRPWTVPEAGRLMGRAHAAIHQIVAPASLPTTRALLEPRIRGSSVPAAGRETALWALDQRLDGDRLSHNDLHPQNVMLHVSGVVIIDWAAASRGDPAADIARSLLLFMVGKPPGTAPLRVRAIAPVATRIFRRGYLAAYRAARPIDEAVVRAWLLPHAVARTVEEVPSERPSLDRLIARLVAEVQGRDAGQRSVGSGR